MRKPLNKLLITCFVWNGQVFRLDQLNLTILKILGLHTVKLVFNCHPCRPVKFNNIKDTRTTYSQASIQLSSLGQTEND